MLKQLETSNKLKQPPFTQAPKHSKHTAIMVLCFLFGGFSIILYSLQILALFEMDLTTGILTSPGAPPIPVFTREADVWEAGLANRSDANISSSGENSSREPGRHLFRASPRNLLFSPFSVILPVLGAVSIAAGFAILDLIRKKEVDFARRTTRNFFLTSGERNVLEAIEAAGGALAQSEISKRLSLSRVKAHRILRDLEEKGIVEKREFGMTNMVVVKGEHLK